MPEVTVRYYAGARAAAGVTEDAVGEVRTVAEALSRARTMRSGLERVLPSCSLLLNGVAVHAGDVPVQAASDLDVLPPFAGG